MCNCRNVNIGTYENTKIINGIELDKCLVPEIKWLWNNGIETVASCCGHNKIEPSIIVKEKYIDKMRKLGYKNKINPIYPKKENLFYSKTISRPRQINNNVSD